MKLYAALARALADQGVDTIFGLVGDANLFMADSFVRDCGGRFIASAHESGATLMALGYGAVTSRVGVATVTMGPGVANTLSALIEGVKGSAPMVLVCGDTGIEERDEIARVNQYELVSATGAGFEPVRSAQTLVQDVATAFRRAQVERRPIALNVPRDLQWQDVEYQKIVRPVSDNRAIVPSSADLDDAAGIIATAKRPLLIAGRGAVSQTAKSAIERLAERIDAPLATTLKGKGLFRGHPNDIGIFGTLSSPEGVETILASDCVVAFGASLNHYTTSRGAFLRGKRVVQVNLEQAEVGKHVRPDAGVVGDPALVADAIVRLLDEAEIASSGFFQERAALRETSDGATRSRVEPGKPGALQLESALIRINAAVPQNRLVVTDAGRFLSKAWTVIDAPDPRHFVLTVNFGSIGMGLSQAIGASVAEPDRPTLLITGDGGFMLGGLAEFNTAVRHRCDLIVVICNDGSYGAEHVQFRARNMDPALSMFEWPDFAPVAEALGGAGVTVRTMDDLKAAEEAVRGRRRPLLIDLKLDPDDMPQLPH